MRKKINQNRRARAGLTLLEVILYLALWSLLVVAMMPVMLDLQGAQSAQSLLIDSQTSQAFVEAKIRGALRNAASVSVPGVGEMAQSLTLRPASPPGNGGAAVTFRLDPELGLIQETGGGGGGGDASAFSIFPTSTKISNLFFDRPQIGEPVSRSNQISFGLVVNGTNFGTTTFFK